MDTWPDQDVEQLKKKVADGMRICDIVRGFQGKYQRGAIVGKIRRMKLVKVTRGNGGPRTPRGRIIKLSDEGKKGVALQLNEGGCSRILCDKEDNFIRNDEGHIMQCGDPVETGPYCPHCTSLLRNPGYGANSSPEKRTPINWKHWIARRGNSPRA